MISSGLRDGRTLRAEMHVISANHGDRTVLLDAEAEQYYSLNITGRAVWDLLCDGTTRDEIVNDLIERFGGQPEQVTADVDRLLEHLINRGLVVVQ